MDKKNPFEKIRQRTNLNPTDIYKIAESVKHANFSDEQTVRNLVKRLTRMANKSLPKETEDKIVHAITSNKIPADMQSLNKYIDK
ncbi:MAG TPA: stage VI sporulation protein F [Cerasibacillus sp.]|uniref:stage VI sporulation protein F n=1 Tax=Cerasibacillus sp. TaxID=2498711 RepID=UPI002F40D82C